MPLTLRLNKKCHTSYKLICNKEVLSSHLPGASKTKIDKEKSLRIELQPNNDLQYFNTFK